MFIIDIRVQATTEAGLELVRIMEVELAELFIEELNSQTLVELAFKEGWVAAAEELQKAEEELKLALVAKV